MLCSLNMLVILLIRYIPLNGLWCWRYSLFSHILLMHVYVAYGVMVQEIGIVVWRLWLSLYVERMCWPWWHEVKGMSCWHSIIAQTYTFAKVTWYFLDTLHIWPCIDDIEGTYTMLSYIPYDILLIDEEDVHVDINDVVVIKWLCWRYLFEAWWLLMSFMVLIQKILHCWDPYRCHLCHLM